LNVAEGVISPHHSPVRKPQILLVVVASLAALVALVAFVAFRTRHDEPSAEPSQNGRSLSEWLASYEAELEGGRDPSRLDEVVRAVQAIGPKALPFLLEWIQYEPPYALPMLPPDENPIHFLTWRAERRGDEAVRGFEFLSSNAVACIPELKSMMRDKARPNAALRATAALSMMGAPAFSHLAAALADTNQPFRERICYWMAGYMVPAVGTNTCLPHLRAAMEDRDPQVRQAASKMVKRLTSPAVTNTAPGSRRP